MALRIANPGQVKEMDISPELEDKRKIRLHMKSGFTKKKQEFGLGMTIAFMSFRATKGGAYEKAQLSSRSRSN